MNKNSNNIVISDITIWSIRIALTRITEFDEKLLKTNNGSQSSHFFLPFK